MKLDNLGEATVSSAVFAGLGLVVFGLAFWVMNKLAPFSSWVHKFCSRNWPGTCSCLGRRLSDG